MREEGEREIIDILHANNPDTRTFNENFACYKHEVFHENRLQVQKTEGKSNSLQIKNFFAITEHERVVKLTQIQLEDRIIHIFDYFGCTPSSAENSRLTKCKSIEEKFSNNQKKLAEKRHKALMSSQTRQECQARHTKNLVKNIFRSFQSWLDEKTPAQLQLGQAMSALLSSNMQKYNNKLVAKLLKDPSLRNAFVMFADTAAEELIAQSRITNKSSHLQAVKKYKKKCLYEEKKDIKGDIQQNIEEQSFESDEMKRE